MNPTTDDQISVTAPGSSNTYTYTLTLTKDNCPGVAPQATVSVGVSCGGGNPPAGSGSNCDFNAPNIWVSASQVSCNSTVQLHSDCQGSTQGCGSVNYSWAGPNGYSAIGSAPGATVPGSSGFYSYTLTLSKDGCTNKMAILSVNVQCSPAPCVAPSSPTGISYNEKSADYNAVCLNSTDQLPVRAACPSGSHGLWRAWQDEQHTQSAGHGR